MAFFDDMKGKISQASQSTVQKTKDFTETVKLNNEISGYEKQINALYARLGEEVYNRCKETPVEGTEELVNEISGLFEKIEADRAAIAAINEAAEKSGGGEPSVCFCSSCGAKITAGSRFCTNCGNKL